MAVNGREKGSNYERKIAKVLGNWWQEDFHRTPMSGGLHWKADNRVAGDIVTPPDSKYPFVTELKKHESWDFDQIIKGTGELEKWWGQVSGDAERTGLRRLLIFSRNFMPDYVMMSHRDFLDIARIVAVRDRSIDFNFYLMHKVDYEDRVILTLADLIKNVSKEDVLKAYNL